MHALLILGADRTIKNEDGLIPNEIALQVYGKPLQKLRELSEVRINQLIN